MGQRKWKVRKCKDHSLVGSSRPHVATNKAVTDWMDLIKAPNNIFRDDCTKSQHGKLWGSMIACPLKHKAAAATGSYPHSYINSAACGQSPADWINAVEKCHRMEDWEEEGGELVYSRAPQVFMFLVGAEHSRNTDTAERTGNLHICRH